MSTPQKGKRPGQSSNTGVNRTENKDTVAHFEVREPARTYAIRAREEAVAPDVIASIFYLFDVAVYALTDPGSTHSYICIVLVTYKNLPIESTEFDVQVTNSLVRAC